MIEYTQHRLDNGLTLMVVEDASTPLVSVNTLYCVGSRDEREDRTGFAHLFEHLMFGGTPRVPDYDAVASQVGAENNAFTNEDVTDYHITVPKQFLETALWLESDRMHGLTFSPQSLAVQQKVVTEEYHYRYLNQPYGDAWLQLRPLAYTRHPYRWSTIGADIRHVQEATLDDVKAFFADYYTPDNAIIAVAGDVHADEVVALVEKWYGDIEGRQRPLACYPEEPEQQERRQLTLRRDVPAAAMYLAYPMCGRTSADFPATDLISDILSNGRSSRLYNRLVKEKQLFVEIDACVTGSADPGLFVVTGKLQRGVEMARAQAAVEAELQRLAEEAVPDVELEKVKNKFENTFVFSQYKGLDCAMSLCYYHSLGHTDWANSEPQNYRRVTADDVQRVAAQLFAPQRQNALYYEPNN